MNVNACSDSLLSILDINTPPPSTPTDIIIALYSGFTTILTFSLIWSYCAVMMSRLFLDKGVIISADKHAGCMFSICACLFSAPAYPRVTRKSGFPPHACGSFPSSSHTSKGTPPASPWTSCPLHYSTQ